VASLSDLPVLITGETGTGKQVLAQAIHQLDPKRSQGPFVAVNCAAINQGLAEAELFGHKRGAYTGAERDRKGLVRSAHGGILFLDEIGELNYTIQGKLLRVLQDSRVLGVGEDEEVPVNVRVISATNRNLSEMVKGGMFREDLFHRLNILSVKIPPLRDRASDIAPLIRHFLLKHEGLSRYKPSGIEDEFLDALGRVELSGNVRQLENVIIQVLINKDDGQPLSLRDLPHALLQTLAHAQNPPEKQDDQPEVCSQRDDQTSRDVRIGSEMARLLREDRWDLSRTLRHCEKSLLRAALEITKGNQVRAAQILGVTPRSVYNLIRRHELSCE
jgi:transcriptional regulator with PAS, ATPase and Fis domain